MQKQRLGFNIILLGQIAAGKDTQAKILLDKYALKPVESGKHWRKMMKAKTPEGDLLRKTTAKGAPAPVALMKKFLIENIDKKPKNKDLLFQGNPRLKPEAQLLKKILDKKKQDFMGIYITLPDKVIYERSLHRNTTDVQDLYKAFDEKKLIAKRIKWHKEQVSKSVAYLESIGKMKKINGNRPIEAVTKDIEKTIEAYRKKRANRT